MASKIGCIAIVFYFYLTYFANGIVFIKFLAVVFFLDAKLLPIIGFSISQRNEWYFLLCCHVLSQAGGLDLATSDCDNVVPSTKLRETTAIN